MSRTMKPMNLVTNSEKDMWREMKQELRAMERYHFKKQYYPHNMDEYDNLVKTVQSEYRAKLNKMVSEREENERAEERKQLEQDAVEGLLKLAKTKNELSRRRERYAARKAAAFIEKDVDQWNYERGLRRSGRIASKNMKSM